MILKDDFNFLFNISMCNNLEEIKERAKFLIVDGLNVGEIWEEFEYNFKLFTEKKFLYISTLYPDIKVKDESPYLFGDVTAEREMVEIFNTIGSISSSNSKSETLIKYYNKVSDFEKNSLLALINLTYSTIFVYDNKSKIFPSADTGDINRPMNLASLISNLVDIAGDDFMLPKAKKEALIDIYNKSNEYIRNILIRILDGNLIPKMSEKTFFDCFGYTNKIRIIPYQRCEKENAISKRARYPMMVQLKADGKFQNIIHASNMALEYEQFYFNNISLNRSGKNSFLKVILDEINAFDKDTKYMTNMWGVPCNIMGEALIKDPNYIMTEECTALTVQVLNRQVGNGLLNSYGQRFVSYKNKIDEIIPRIGKASGTTAVTKLIQQLLEWKRVEENLIMQIWEIVPFQQWLELKTDFTMLKSFSYASDFVSNYNAWVKSKGKTSKFLLIWNEFVHSIDEVYEKYNHINKVLGFEGIVAKNTTAEITHGVCTDGKIKFKDFKECDLRIIGHMPGEKQFVGGIGSYICESECGTMVTSVAGLSMDQRGFQRIDLNDSAKGIILKDNHDNDANIGRIINAKFNELSKNKNGTPSLSLASFVEFRDDVNKAETYEEIVNKVKAKKNVTKEE